MSTQISPYLPTLREQCTQLLHTILSIPTDTKIDWSSEPDWIKLVVQFNDPAQTKWILQLYPPKNETDSFRFKHIFGPRVLFLRLLRDVKRKQLPLEELPKLIKAIERWKKFENMRDSQFRQVLSSPEGMYGQLRIGYGCNQNCWFCWQGRKWPTPPIDNYWRWLDEFKELGVHMVNFTGGEPTLFKELLPLMRKAQKLGMDSTIQTNAIRLAKQTYLEQLIEAGLTLAMVSYHSADADISDRMTKAKGTHKRTKEGIVALAKNNVPYTLNCVVEKANYQHLKEHAQDIVDHFARPFSKPSLKRVSYTQPTHYFNEESWHNSMVHLSQVSPHLIEAHKILHEHGVDVQVIGSCGFPLCIFKAYNAGLNSQLALQLRYNQDEVTHRHYAAVCQQCNWKTACTGIRKEYTNAFGEAGLNPLTLPLPSI